MIIYGKFTKLSKRWLVNSSLVLRNRAIQVQISSLWVLLFSLFWILMVFILEIMSDYFGSLSSQDDSGAKWITSEIVKIRSSSYLDYRIALFLRPKNEIVVNLEKKNLILKVDTHNIMVVELNYRSPHFLSLSHASSWQVDTYLLELGFHFYIVIASQQKDG